MHLAKIGMFAGSYFVSSDAIVRSGVQESWIKLLACIRVIGPCSTGRSVRYWIVIFPYNRWINSCFCIIWLIGGIALYCSTFQDIYSNSICRDLGGVVCLVLAINSSCRFSCIFSSFSWGCLWQRLRRRISGGGRGWKNIERVKMLCPGAAWLNRKYVRIPVNAPIPKITGSATLPMCVRGILMTARSIDRLI